MVSTCRPEKAARFVFPSMRPRQCAHRGRFETLHCLNFIAVLPKACGATEENF